MPKRIYGYNGDGVFDSVVSQFLPYGWSSKKQDIQKTPDTPIKRGRGRPKKVVEGTATPPEAV